MIENLDVGQPNAEHCSLMADRVFKASGLNIAPSKRDFISLRASKRVRALGLRSFDEYASILSNDTDGKETRLLVEALTTHTTSFFRESRQYDWLAGEGLDRLSASRKGELGQLTVWSAACSTGAELWSAGMVLSDMAMKSAKFGKFALIGSDISRRILTTAVNATYTEPEVSGVSSVHRNRYLLRSKSPIGPSRQFIYRIAPELRQKAKFHEINLSKLTAAHHFSVDIAFLRNVLIYFDEELQSEILVNMISRLKPGGLLFTGHSEAVPRGMGLRSLGPSTYEKE